MIFNGIASGDKGIGVAGGMIIFTLSPILSLSPTLAVWSLTVICHPLSPPLLPRRGGGIGFEGAKPLQTSPDE
jgi:hypothetical protein